MYLDLLEKCLLDSIYNPQPNVLEGKAIPERAHTMIGKARLRQLREACERTMTHGVRGDFVETGVWRGGASILMAGIADYYDLDCTTWVCDSFEGLPPPDTIKYPADTNDRHHTRKELAVSLEEVQENFRRYGLLDNRVQFLKGWFKDTLPGPIGQIAVLRLDGDMYGSTWDVLTALYSMVSPGGYIIVDDYALCPCKQAVEDFRAKHGISTPIEMIDWTGIYWRKQ